MREGRIMTIDHFPVRPLPLSHPPGLPAHTGDGALAPWHLLAPPLALFQPGIGAVRPKWTG